MLVTGLGAVCSLGEGCEALWRGMLEGRDGIDTIRRFSTEGFAVHIAGLVPRHNEVDVECPSSDLVVLFAVQAAREAWASAGLNRSAPRPERVALVMGASPADHRLPVHEMTERVADALAVRGPRITISTACSSSTNAIGMAIDVLDMNAADVVIAGGADALTPLLFAGFHALGVLSPAKCAPFSHPFGTTLGEGAGFLIVERAPGARARRAPERVGLLGYGLSADAFHETSPDPTGSGVARGIQSALAHAALDPERVGYVSAHGTGTMANDPAEWRALRAVFNGHAERLPVSASKSFLGHAQAAAGVLEAIATILAMERGVLPPTMNFSGARPNGPTDPVAQQTPRPHEYRYAVCTNSAFGGANAALVFGPATVSEPSERERAIEVRGVGALGAFGTSIEALLAGLESLAPVPAARVPTFPLEALLPSVDPGGLDPSSKYLTAAAALALGDAQIRRLRGKDRDKTGLALGITSVSPASERELRQSIEQRSLPHLSATAFSKMVLNAPAGVCSQLLAIRGPISTLSVGPGSGLVAVVYAAELLATRPDLERMLAGGVDEIDPQGPSAERSEGAAILLLSRTMDAAASRVLLSGWALAGPGELDLAVATSLERARMLASGVDLFFGSSSDFGCAPNARHFDPIALWGPAEASAAAGAVVVATECLRRGLGRTALVAMPRASSASCALVLEKVEPAT